MDIIKQFYIPIKPVLLISIIDLPIFIIVLKNYSKINNLISSTFKKKLRIIILYISAVIIIEVITYFNGYSLVQIAKDKYTGENKIVEKYGTLVNNIVELAINKSTSSLISQFKYGKPISSKIKGKNNPNFILIQVESMDAEILTQKFKNKLIMPYMNSLLDTCIYYPYTLSYHKAGATSDSEFSVLNSIEPLSTYPSSKLRTYDYSNSFVKRLVKHSYNTIALHGNHGDYFNRNVNFSKMGFESFFDMELMQLHDEGWGASDKKVFDFTYNKLKTQKTPFLSYTITMTSHGPFTNVYNYYVNPSYNSIKNKSIKDYFNSMNYVDKTLFDFVSKVKNNFKNTYIFIWGDHAPNISSNLYKQASFVMDNKSFEFVPLIIITPDNKVHKEQDYVASFLDFAPSILNAAKISYEIKSDGKNLLNFTQTNTQQFQIPFEGGVFDRKFLYEKISSESNKK